MIGPTEERSNVFLWLSTLGLQGYTNTFETNGFDDVKFMVREERREGEGKGWEGEGKGREGEGRGEKENMILLFVRVVACWILRISSKWGSTRTTKGEYPVTVATR